MIECVLIRKCVLDSDWQRATCVLHGYWLWQWWVWPEELSVNAGNNPPVKTCLQRAIYW